MMHEEHHPYIRECVRLAREAMHNGNRPFGSILVHDGEILLRAQNTVLTENDIGRHPESVLARAAASRYDADVLAESTLYTSTEPCAMCTGAIYWSGIGRVVFAVSVPKLYTIADGGLPVRCADILKQGSRQVEVIGPVLEDEAFEVHRAFWERD